MDKKILFEDYEHLTEEIISSINNGHESVALVGYYGTVCDVMNMLIKDTKLELISADLHDYDYDEYEDAYYLEVDAENNQIWIGKMKWENDRNYITLYDEVVFVEEDFSEEYFKNNSKDGVFVIGFTDVVDNEDKSCLCFDDDNCGFSFCINTDMGRSKFKYRGNTKLTPEDAWEIVSEYF